MGQTNKGTCAFPAKTNRFIFLYFQKEKRKILQLFSCKRGLECSIVNHVLSEQAHLSSSGMEEFS